MIVEIILNYERTSGGHDKVWIDTDKLRTYTPLTNKMPANIVRVIEKTNLISIAEGPTQDSFNSMLRMSGMGSLATHTDWWSDEYPEMLRDGVITTTRPSHIDKEFEIHFC